MWGRRMSYGVKTVMVQKGLYLDRRANSPNWYGRLTLQNGARHRFTTGTSDLAQAKINALRHVIALEERVRNNLPINTRTFVSVAEATKQELDQRQADGIGKKVYEDYKDVIDNYLIPFFGSMHIATITQSTLQQFDVWRIQKMKRKPSYSTLNTHNAAFNRVLDYAEKFGWVTNASRPQPQNEGRKSESRGAFSNTEYNQIARKLRHWSKQQQKPHPNVTFAREVLRNYILILANTGMRHGTEALGLKWSNLSWFDNGVDAPFLQISVNGKTGKRTLIARDRSALYFERQRRLYTHLQGENLIDFLKQKSSAYVFADRNGKPITSHAINQNFNEFLSTYKLKTGADGKDRTPYSLRHYYITKALLRGIPIHDIALQVGTSVKMIEAFYSKVSPLLQAKLHSGRAFYGGSVTGAGNQSSANDAQTSSAVNSAISDEDAELIDVDEQRTSTTSKRRTSVKSKETPDASEFDIAINLLLSGTVDEALFLLMVGRAKSSGSALDAKVRKRLYEALQLGKLSPAGLGQIIR